MSPSVAICIPTYNQADYLAQAVESACAQTYPCEVWVADDCSTDRSAEVLQDLQKRYPQLHAHRQERNSGITGNNNWLLAQPTTEFIVRLDSDDVLHPQYVEKLVALLNQHPIAGYAHCAVQEIDEKGGLRRMRRLGSRNESQSAEEALRASASGYRVAANICMFRTHVLHDLQFYRPAVIYSQDWDLSVRIADAGWGNVYLDETLASYRVWEDAGKVRPKRKQIEVQDCVRIFDQSLAPAFTKRGWDLAPLWKFRRGMALTHATVLDADVFSASERVELIALLQKLGASPALRLRLAMIRLGLGALLRWQYRLNVMLRDRAKQVLGLLRRRGAASAETTGGERA